MVSHIVSHQLSTMSNRNFVKGQCQRCAGHLEFPADAAGDTIPCPHCGQPTGLITSVYTNKNNGIRRVAIGITVLILLVVIALAAVILIKKKPASAVSANQTALAAQTNLANAGNLPASWERTNDFAISTIKLEKTSGSSLVYASGTVRNLGGQRRFGVKISVQLIDAENQPVGQSQDYQPLMEPNAEWHFKALVLGAKAVSARINSISEDR